MRAARLDPSCLAVVLHSARGEAMYYTFQASQRPGSVTSTRMSDQQRRRERTRTFVTLGWMTLLFVHTGLAFAIATPLFQNPDEPTHVDLARHYAHHPTELAGPSLRQTQGSRGAI